MDHFNQRRGAGVQLAAELRADRDLDLAFRIA
jgi:hypothetical protein